MNRKSAAELWDDTVRIFRESSYENTSVLGEHIFLGRFQRSTRLFLKGDVVLLSLTNGQASRAHVTGRSSRGYSVSRYYQQYQRWFNLPRFHWDWERDKRMPEWQRSKAWQGRIDRSYTNRTSVQLLELPDELVGLPPADPVVRRYVVERLCVADAARP